MEKVKVSIVSSLPRKLTMKNMCFTKRNTGFKNRKGTVFYLWLHICVWPRKKLIDGLFKIIQNMTENTVVWQKQIRNINKCDSLTSVSMFKLEQLLNSQKLDSSKWTSIHFIFYFFAICVINPILLKLNC